MTLLDEIWENIENFIDSIDSNEILEPNLKNISFYVIIIAFLIFIRWFYGRNMTSVFVVLLILLFQWKKKRDDEKYVRILMSYWLNICVFHKLHSFYFIFDVD